MCGRYNFSAEEAEDIKKIVQEINDRLNGPPIKTGEIYPTNLVPVLLEEEGRMIPKPMIWGFPHFKNSGVIINARSETVTDKKMFRDSVITRRCLVPSSGFYEWKKEGSSKTKLLFRHPGETALYMAGFWNSFRGKNGEEQRFVILTTQANDSMLDDTGELSLFPSDKALIHDRMPVILRPEERVEWLQDGADFEKLFRREDVLLEHIVA